jgi:hypothetical protein
MSESFSPDPSGSDPSGSEAYAVEFVDIDGDGYQETTVLDTDGDAVIDTALVDVDGDGYDDVAAFDNVPDGEFVPDVVAVDVDGDGCTDIVSDDTDLDGVFDTDTYPVDTPLIDANPYAAGPFDASDTSAAPTGSGSGEGSVIAGEGGDAIYIDPSGTPSFSGSDIGGTTYTYDGGS